LTMQKEEQLVLVSGLLNEGTIAVGTTGGPSLCETSKLVVAGDALVRVG